LKEKTWNNFVLLRDKFRFFTEKILKEIPELNDLQQKLVSLRGSGVYRIDTPVVYNTALDRISITDEIKLILVADNPGRREQAAENRCYLTGPSGKIAAGFFKKNPELGIDYNKNILILNKSPIHTPRTLMLKQLCDLGGEEVKKVFIRSQRDMVSLIFDFHQCFFTENPLPVWVIGYSEMHSRGLFGVFTEALRNAYKNQMEMYEYLYLFQHFSMNRFTIDFNKQCFKGESCINTLKRTGISYRNRILDF